MAHTPRTLTLMLCALLAGCDALGLPNPAKEAAQAEADAKAVGASCRHAGRALEDCFVLNPDQSRSQIFAGWREMHDYMAAGNIAVVAPTIEKTVPKATSTDEVTADEKPQDEPPPKKSSKKKSDDSTHAKAEH